MKVINHTLPRDFNLFLIGDSHEGTILRSDKGWEQFVDMLNSDYGDLKASRNRWCDHGDMVEAIATDDKRYFDLTHKKGSTVTRQIDIAIKQREKIKKKCLFILQGNHERKLHRYGDFVGDPEVENSICKSLNVPYGTYECVSVYNDAQGFLMFRHFASHGFRSIRSAAKDADQRLGNRLASLKILLQWKFANCLLMSIGHTHQLLVNKPKQQLAMMENGGGVEREYTSPRKVDGFIHPDFRFYVNCGSFLDIYADGVSSYASVAGHDPSDLGFAIARIRKGVIADIDEIKLT